jgi:predicted nucleic acid-binding protein
MPIINIADPSCPLPNALMIDASFLLEINPALSTVDPVRRTVSYHFALRLKREIRERRLTCITPVSTLQECFYKILQAQFKHELPSHRLRLRSKLGKTEIRWNDLYKDSPGLIRTWMPLLEQFRRLVAHIPILVREPETGNSSASPIDSEMLLHIQNVALLPQDAYFLAAADRFGIPYVLTLDGDFKRANWVTVYTYPP